jgi:hypothetical protein
LSIFRCGAWEVVRGFAALPDAMHGGMSKQARLAPIFSEYFPKERFSGAYRRRVSVIPSN